MAKPVSYEEGKFLAAVWARHRALKRILGEKHDGLPSSRETGFGRCDCYEIVFRQWMSCDFDLGV